MKPMVKPARKNTWRSILVIVVLGIGIAVAFAVTLSLSLNKSSDSTAPFTVVASFVASGSVSDYGGTKRSEILNALSSAAGLGSTAPVGATLDVTAGSVNLISTLPVASEAAADAAIGALQSAVETPAALTSLLVANNIAGITVEQITSIDKAKATPLSELERQMATADASLLSNLKVEPYDSCRTLARSMRLWPGQSYGSSVRLSSRYGGFEGGGIVEDVVALAESSSTRGAVADSSAGASAASSASAAADDFSTTNVQVEGIDESDIVKNDGRFIYSIGGSQLVIVRAYPATLRQVVSRTSLRAGVDGSAAELFAAEEALLDGDMLLILSAAKVGHPSPSSPALAFSSAPLLRLCPLGNACVQCICSLGECSRFCSRSPFVLAHPSLPPPPHLRR